MIARSTWGQQQFGATSMPQGSPGQVFDDGAGNRYLMATNGQWVSMQGMGELVQAGPLGELVQAGPLGRYAGGYEPLGHLMPADTPDPWENTAVQMRAGSRDPYLATMTAAG